MKVFSFKMLIAYLLFAFIAVTSVYGVMQYWYKSILSLHKQHLVDIVYSRKNSLLSTYVQTAESQDAFALSLATLKDHFHNSISDDLNHDFTIITKENGTYYSLYKCIDSKPIILKKALGSKYVSTPAEKALQGADGVTEEVNEHGEKLVTAYDSLDIGGKKIVLLASVPYAEISKPRYAAIISAVGICLVMFISGGLIFFVMNKKNIDELRRVNKEKETFGHIMDSAKELIAYVDVDGKYTAVNDAYEILFGVPKHRIVGMHLREFHGDIRYNNFFKEAFEACLEGEAVKRQIWYELTGQNKSFFDMSFVPHYVDSEVHGVVIVANDITELENAKLELLGKTRDLKKLTTELEVKVSQETKKRIQHEQLFFEQKKFSDMGQMINAIAHQWRQPINALGLYIQYIVESTHDKSITPEVIDEFQRDSLRLVQHLSKTIDDFRGFFEPSKNKTEFQVVHAVAETVSLVDAQLKSHFIEYNVSCKCEHTEFLSCNDTEHPPCEYPMTLVAGYPSEFKQVLMNLVQNAKDVLVSKQKDKLLSVDITASDNEVVISVCDNGGGIPDDIMGNIFDPYFTTKPEGKGTGIGLYMSKLIVEDHMKGKLTAFNKDGGACFEIALKKIMPKAV